jgi:hypothetical protein
MDTFNSPVDFAGLTIIDEDVAPAPVSNSSRTTFASAAAGTSTAGLFSSPSSVASGSTGGVKLGSTMGLVHVGNVVEVCGGVISNSDRQRFCCKVVGSCATKGHKIKLKIAPNTLYIQHTRAGQGRFEPSLSVGLIPDDVVIEELLSKDCPLEVWTAYFDAVKAGRAAFHLASPGSTDGLSSPWEEVPSLDSLRKASDTFRTPKRLKLGRLLSPENVPVLSSSRNSPLVKVFPLEPEDTAENQSMEVERELRKIFEDWNKIQANFQSVHLELDSTARAEIKYRLSVNDVMGNIQEAVQETDSRMQILQASLGDQVDDPEGGPMSIWEAITRLRVDSARIGALSDGSFLYLDELRKTIPNWGTTLENLSASYLDTIPKINRNLVTMRSRLGALEETKTPPNPFGSIGIGILSQDLDGNGPGPSIDRSYVLQGDFENTKKEIDEAFAVVTAAIKSSGGGGNADLNIKVEKAMLRLGDIEGRVTGESYAEGGHVFSSMTEVGDWLIKEKVPSGGVFWDLFSVLVCMKPKQQTGKGRADETYSAQRTKSTTMENDLLASMTHIRPELLFAKKGGSELGKLDDGFAACPSYQMWITGGEAYKTVLTDLISKYCDGVLGAVDQMTSHRLLVMVLLTNVKAQWNEMCTFIDSFYIELTNVAGFSADKAWKLVGRCCATLFSVMQPYRAPIAMLPDLGPLESKASCLWAVLQSHRVAKAFELVKYRGHPSVVKEMSLFMLTERVDPTEISTISERAKKADKAAAEAQAEVVKLKDTISGLKRDFANLKQDFASVKKSKP